MSAHLRSVIEADAVRYRRRRRVWFAILSVLALGGGGTVVFLQVTSPTCDRDIEHRTAGVCYDNPAGWPEAHRNGSKIIGTSIGARSADPNYVLSTGPFEQSSLADGFLTAATNLAGCATTISMKPIEGHRAATVVCEGDTYVRVTVVDIGDDQIGVVEGHARIDVHEDVDAVMDSIEVLD